MSNETVNQVLAEFGQQIGLDELRLGENGATALAFDDVVVNLEADGETGRLLLSAYLGEPQGDPRATYELLLDANFCWQGTDGATLSLERETGGIVLFQALPIRTLDLQGLEATLETFVNNAETWTRMLAQPAEPVVSSTLPNREQPIIRG